MRFSQRLSADNFVPELDQGPRRAGFFTRHQEAVMLTSGQTAARVTVPGTKPGPEATEPVRGGRTW